MRVSTGNPLNLVCMGDSQTAERSFAVANGGAYLIQTYPFLVARNRGYGCVTNVGISGNTTTQMEARFAADVLAHRPGAISIQGCVNDMTTNISGGVTWTGLGTSVATTKAKLKSMVQAGQAQRARVTLISPFPIREAVYTSNFAPYAAMFLEIEDETGCEYLDLYSRLAGLSAAALDALYITGDTNHPNTAGHAYLAAMAQETGNESMFAQY